MRTPPSLADFTHARPCKPICEKSLTPPTTRNYEKFTLLIPASINGAFACELFLKALLGTPLRGHKLYNDLFCKKDLSTAQEIETVTIECLKKKKNTIINSEQFISNFKVIERSFEEFRYFYEPQINSEMKVYSIDFLEVLVFSLRAVCEQRFGIRPVQD